MHGRNAAIATLLLGLTVAPANAATYSYTGKNYTAVFGLSYTPSMSVTGVFEVASPLLGNIDQTFSPLSYSFFDGVQTLNNANSSVSVSASTFSIKTNSRGEIVDWTIQILGLTGPSRIGVTMSGDSASRQDGIEGPNIAFNEAPGTWQRTDVSVVPVPAALPLMASGLGALGLIGWRKRKAAAAA